MLNVCDKCIISKCMCTVYTERVLNSTSVFQLPHCRQVKHNTAPLTPPIIPSSHLSLHIFTPSISFPPLLLSFSPLISPSCFDLQPFPSWLVAIETEPPRPVPPLSVFCHWSREKTKKTNKKRLPALCFPPLVCSCLVETAAREVYRQESI